MKVLQRTALEVGRRSLSLLDFQAMDAEAALAYFDELEAAEEGFPA